MDESSALADAPVDQPAGVSAIRRVACAAPLVMDARRLVTSYANFVQVTGTPEEVILDLGLERPAIGTSGGSPHKVAVPAGRTLDQRIVLSFVTTKRLWRAIQLAVQRHETNFGPLETDVRRRLTKP